MHLRFSILYAGTIANLWNAVNFLLEQSFPFTPFLGEYAGTQGLGLLRLHSTYRHDLKIYASDEGRVQMTAAAFAKGLLALEGELTPILVQVRTTFFGVSFINT